MTPIDVFLNLHQSVLETPVPEGASAEITVTNTWSVSLPILRHRDGSGLSLALHILPGTRKSITMMPDAGVEMNAYFWVISKSSIDPQPQGYPIPFDDGVVMLKKIEAALLELDLTLADVDETAARAMVSYVEGVYQALRNEVIFRELH